MRMLNGSSTPNTSLPTPQALTGHCQSTRPAQTLFHFHPAGESSASAGIASNASPVEVEPVVSGLIPSLTWSDLPEILCREDAKTARKPRECGIYSGCAKASRSVIDVSASAWNSGGFWFCCTPSVPPARESLTRQRLGYRCVLRVPRCRMQYFCTKVTSLRQTRSSML